MSIKGYFAGKIESRELLRNSFLLYEGEKARLLKITIPLRLR